MWILKRIKQNTHIKFSFKLIHFLNQFWFHGWKIFHSLHKHKIYDCVGNFYACIVLTMTWMTCHMCCMGESSRPDASWSCAWLTPTPGRWCASPNRPSSSPPHASPPPPPYRPGQTPPTQLPPGLTALVILLVEYLQSCIKSLPFRLLLTSSPCSSLIFSSLAKSDGEARQDDVGEAEEMQQRAYV